MPRCPTSHVSFPQARIDNPLLSEGTLECLCLLFGPRASQSIKIVVQGREDKLEALTELCKQQGLRRENIAYVGDDLPDIRVMKAVRLSFAVDNAHSSVKSVAHLQTELSGGSGAVREVCDFILQAQERYDDAIAPYL